MLLSNFYARVAAVETIFFIRSGYWPGYFITMLGFFFNNVNWRLLNLLKVLISKHQAANHWTWFANSWRVKFITALAVYLGFWILYIGIWCNLILKFCTTFNTSGDFILIYNLLFQKLRAPPSFNFLGIRLRSQLHLIILVFCLVWANLWTFVEFGRGGAIGHDDFFKTFFDFFNTLNLRLAVTRFWVQTACIVKWLWIVD